MTTTFKLKKKEYGDNFTNHLEQGRRVNSRAILRKVFCDLNYPMIPFFNLSSHVLTIHFRREGGYSMHLFVWGLLRRSGKFLGTPMAVKSILRKVCELNSGKSWSWEKCNKLQHNAANFSAQKCMFTQNTQKICCHNR